MPRGHLNDDGKVMVDFPVVFKAIVGGVGTLIIAFIIGLAAWLWDVRADISAFGEKLDGLVSTTERHERRLETHDERIRALEMRRP